MLSENSFFVVSKFVLSVLLMSLTIAPVTSESQAKKTRINRPRKQSPLLATPAPRLVSAHLLLKRSSVVVVTKSGVPAFHISVVVRNGESYQVSNVRVFLRGRGGILLPMRGGRSIPPRSEVAFYIAVRELFDPKIGISCVFTCDQCSSRQIS